jgi:HKD family nuclease
MVTLSVASMTFPSATVGTTNTAQPITLTNGGNAALNISGITLTGANASAFAETTTCTSVLSPGNSCTISTTFTPQSAGNFAAAISIADNVSGSPQTVALSGTGTMVLVPQAALSPASLTFAGTTMGTTSAAQTVTLSNPGTGTLTITGITVTGANAAAFTENNTCGSSLAAGANCTISTTFTPTAVGSFSAAISVADNATGSPQILALSGTGTAVLTPQAVLSPTGLLFAGTMVGTISSPQSITLTNSGTLALSISGITITGTNSTDFALSANTCGTSLAVGANCTISVTFTPASAASFSAAVSVADSASGSPQTVTLSGTGTAVAVTHTLITVPEADLGVTPIVNFINTATTSLDMTMYELVDTNFQTALVALAAKGVKVRVILDQSLEKSSNTPVYNYLNANGVQAVWSNKSFQACHQKTITVDNKISAIMTLNLTSRYYYDTRDFAVIDSDPNDVAAIETVFNNDFVAGPTTFPTPYGTDLIWSPTNAQTALIALIGSAKVSLNVENEEMGDAAIVTALSNAAKAGVHVQVSMTSDGSYNSQFTALKAAGVQIHTYTETAPLYIHAKVIIVDYGQTGQQAFVGSENFSNASLNQNRELGLTMTTSLPAGDADERRGVDAFLRGE